MNNKLFFQLFLILIIPLSGFCSTTVSKKVPGQFIVKFSESAQVGKILSSIAASVNGKLKKLSGISKSVSMSGNPMQNYYLYNALDTTLSISEIQQIIGSNNIEYIEPNYYLELFDFPQDSLFTHQWYLHNVGQMYYGIERIDGYDNDLLVLKSGVVGEDIGLTNYYTNTPVDKTKIIVAIIDTGVDVTHPELQGQFWINVDEIPLNGIDDDHNGYVDDTLGYDVSGDSITYFNQIGDNDPTDLVGHGSHIAGIVAAKNDSIGIVGIAPNALIMPIKVFPSFTSAIAVEAIVYAVDNGADIISISWGSLFESTVLKEALTYARSQDVFVSIAAGNTGGTDRFYPQAFDSSFVVGASNSSGYLTSFTTYGAHIDIVAPGEDILSLRGANTDLYESTEPYLRMIGDDSLYFLADGTSMSTPIVAGAAALLLSIKPELTVPEIEKILTSSAKDIIDPFHQGDTLIGYDTLSGYGILNIDNALSLLEPEGLSFVTPRKKDRFTTSEVQVRITEAGGYNDFWSLSYRLSVDSAWLSLVDGNTILADSLVYTFDTTFPTGHYFLKLIDVYGNETLTDFYFVHQRKLELTSPSNNDIVDFDVTISGSAYGPDFDSLVIMYKNQGSFIPILSGTKEFYDSYIFNWKISGIDPGNYTMFLYGFYQSQIFVDSVTFQLNSVFADGWPQSLGTNGALSPIIADLNHDNNNELYIASGTGLFGFNAQGQILPGFPALAGLDVRSIPAVYDITRDGNDEIIITADSGIYVIKSDGTIADGWPQYCETGAIAFGHGFPNPTVTQLGNGEDSAIVILNTSGEILAYEFNGDSYFFSLEGIFTTIPTRSSDGFLSGGKTSPFVTSVDINNDGYYEVLSSYSAPPPYSGVSIFEGRTGLPFLSETDAVVILEREVFSTAIADIGNDDQLEIISLGKDTLGVPTLWVKTEMTTDYPGWPVAIEDIYGWFISPFTLADLNLDGEPEIMFTAFWYDIAHLFIFNSDGSPYKQLSNAPLGAVYSVNGTFGIPVAANVYGDESPEIILRSGHILPGSGPEQLHIVDNQLNPIPGWPSNTPASFNQVFSKQYAPLVDDLDSDGLVEIILMSDNSDILVWDFDASYENGKNKVRYLGDNLNTNYFKPHGIAANIDDDIHNLPQSFSLSQNYPNPFNPSTTIEFELPKKDEIQLTLFNILGQKVLSLADGVFDAGLHKVKFENENLASGIYLYRLQSTDNSATKKMVLLK